MTTTGYGTNAGAIAYWAARGVTLTDDATLTAARLIASDYLDSRYRSMFPGYKYGQRAQEREWPRSWAMDREGYALPYDEVPREVEWATYELAYRQIQTPGSLFVDVTMGETIRSVTVQGAVSITYAGGGSSFDYQLTIPAVDAILAPILTAIGSGSSVSGTIMRV